MPSRGDLAWATGIALYIGLIYATAPFISAWRKTWTEAFGYRVYDWILWLFIPPLLAAIAFVLRRRRGHEWVRSLAVLACTTAAFGWYLLHLKHPIERIHFVQYGLLGYLAHVAALRRGGPAFAAIASLGLTVLAGLGDEWIQHFSPNRVAEIRDVLLNALGGLLGICLALAMSGPGRPAAADLRARVRLLQAVWALAAVSTLLFLMRAHGFGHRIDSPEAGIFFSAFTVSELKSGRASDGILLADDPVYLDEGDRHLLQREFYCGNDFLAADGSFYRDWSRCWMENAVLERFYAEYLKRFAGQNAGERLRSLDPKWAEKAAGNPLIWNEEMRQALEQSRPHPQLLPSRVKAKILTDIALPDLLFFTALALAAIAWIGEQVLRFNPRGD